MQLRELLSEGVSAGHTIEYMRQALERAGFQSLDLGGEWELRENERYYVNLFGTNGLAFVTGNNIGKDVSFRVGMAHSDCPCFQLKPQMNLKGGDSTRWNVEIYGGMNQKSWFDRPLGVAGQVIVRGEDVFSPKTLLYKSDRPLAVIPSLAIHMDRELNKKGALDVAKELVPIAGLSAGLNLLDEIAGQLGIDRTAILDYDLYLYNVQPPELVGLDKSMLSAARLDNLTSVGAMLSAFCGMEHVSDNTVAVMAVFDNEEVGSRSKQGADSELLSLILNRIGRSFDKEFSMENAVMGSFLLSIDVAHANHPNYEDKSDATNKAVLGNGFSVKRSIGQKYGTTSVTGAVIRQLAEKYDIPYTVAINKTGIAGGSTLGPIASSYLPFPCADIGMPILAMHSACELGAVSDYDALKRIVNVFYMEESTMNE